MGLYGNQRRLLRLVVVARRNSNSLLLESITVEYVLASFVTTAVKQTDSQVILVEPTKIFLGLPEFVVVVREVKLLVSKLEKP